MNSTGLLSGKEGFQCGEVIEDFAGKKNSPVGRLSYEAILLRYEKKTQLAKKRLKRQYVASENFSSALHSGFPRDLQIIWRQQPQSKGACRLLYSGEWAVRRPPSTPNIVEKYRGKMYPSY